MSDFELALYQEHLEEASFLYEQRLTLYNNPETTWLRIGEFEDRFDAHIDALANGGDPALEICRQQAGEGDAGARHAVACVFCRLGRKDLVVQILERLDPQDVKALQAVSDALSLEMRPEWKKDFMGMLETSAMPQLNILARLAGFYRLSASKALLKILSEQNPQNPAVIFWALGRLDDRSARQLIWDQYLRHKVESVSINALLALLRMGDREALEFCLQSGKLQDWPDTLLGISAGSSAASMLLQKTFKEKPSADCLLGLGLLGDSSAVEALLDRLSHPEAAGSAALALNLITGAEIYEDAFIPDEINEDELFPEELEKFRQGQPPTRPDGKPYGVTITRLSQKPDDWRGWWAKNRQGFKEGIRYRNGKPFSPVCLLENIEGEKSPFKIRQLANEELAIRYGVDFPFEANMYVPLQKTVIRDITLWVKANANRFKPGTWYFDGQPLA